MNHFIQEFIITHTTFKSVINLNLMIFLYKKFIRKSKSLMNFLIIDVSYFNFWRFFATKLWYTKAHEDEQIEQGYDWTQNQVFMEKYKKMYFQTLKKYIKKFKPMLKIILARDCKRQTDLRMNFYPNIKEHEMKSKRNNLWEEKYLNIHILILYLSY